MSYETNKILCSTNKTQPIKLEIAFHYLITEKYCLNCNYQKRTKRKYSIFLITEIRYFCTRQGSTLCQRSCNFLTKSKNTKFLKKSKFLVSK